MTNGSPCEKDQDRRASTVVRFICDKSVEIGEFKRQLNFVIVVIDDFVDEKVRLTSSHNFLKKMRTHARSSLNGEREYVSLFLLARIFYSSRSPLSARMFGKSWLE
jgi:hypothetical protein